MAYKDDRIMTRCWYAATKNDTRVIDELKKKHPDLTDRIDFLFEHHKQVLEQCPYLRDNNKK